VPDTNPSPKVAIVAVIANPNNPSTATDVRDLQLQDAARTLQLRLHVVNVTSEDEFDTAFTTIIQQGAGALLTGADQVPCADVEADRIRTSWWWWWRFPSGASAGT
jgi:hypothetical protein